MVSNVRSFQPRFAVRTLRSSPTKLPAWEEDIMGKKQSCVKFKKVLARSAKGKKLAFRCVKFQRGLKHPKCTPEKLRGGGRSQFYIRGPGSHSCTKG